VANNEENRGSGTSIDDPYRLAPAHPALGAASQKMLISHVYGEQNKDWFDAGRTYHANDICEQKIRLPSGQMRSVFFDESALDYSIPIPEKFRGTFEQAATNLPVPDTQLVSRFPLIEVKANTAAKAGKIVATHLSRAKEQGWKMVRGTFFVDGWRNDYELVRADESTVMSFDMRPALLADSKLRLITFTAFDSVEAVEQVAARFEAMKAAEKIAEVDIRQVLRSASIGGACGAVITLMVSHSLSDAVCGAVAGSLIMVFVASVVAFHDAATHGLKLRFRFSKQSRNPPD
jgi:hypothetical protein